MPGKRTGTLTLETPASEISYGSTIRISFTTENVDLPATYVRCYQNGKLVYASGGWPPQAEFTLSSQGYTGGEAEGHASLEVADPDRRGKTKVLDEVNFQVNAAS